MGVVPFTYTRPKHVSQQSLSSSAPRLSTDSDESAQSGCSNGIPNSLAFDRIIQGGTCPVSVSFPNSIGLPSKGSEVVLVHTNTDLSV